MTSDQVAGLAEHLARQLTGGGAIGNGSAPFTVQFGYVSTVCKIDGVLIRDASPAVTSSVIRWAETQQPRVYVSATNDGLMVR
jgi:hypothetical protein